MNLHGTKAIFFDLDGTLIKRDDGPFDDDKAAMMQAAEKGHLLFLNTGRSFGNLPQYVLDLPFLKGIAAGGGSHISLAAPPGENPRFSTVYHNRIPEEVLEKIFAWYTRQPHPCTLEGERECYVINKISRHHTARPLIPVDSLEDFKRKSGGDFITKLTLERIASQEELSLFEPFFNVNIVVNYTEANLKGDSKATAVEFLLEKFGIARENSIAIGDSGNDLDMFRACALGIAMGNAPADIKAEAGAVTGDCGKGGVAQALEKFVL
ncbi:MAG: HAD family hydrolase [Spirochaetes bacterium]|nr:HAD family hydrolase [Spirochaetota bacterium]